MFSNLNNIKITDLFNTNILDSKIFFNYRGIVARGEKGEGKGGGLWTLDK
jgi:hypothetical protein